MPRNPDAILSESFLDVRAKLLEVAATLDRIDRAAKDKGTANKDASVLSPQQNDLRLKIDEAIRICLTDGCDRAERLQTLFSRQFDPNWRSEMKL